MELLKLMSGSDIRGNAIETASGEMELTDEVVEDITAAFVVFLKNIITKTPLKIAVGKDSRLSGERIESAVLRSLQQSGAEVFCCSLCSTPSMFMMTKYPQTDCDASIMITASHHPFNKNGLKFFTKNGGLTHDEIGEILRLAKEKKNVKCEGAKEFKEDYLGLYCEGLLRFVRAECGCDTPLEGFKVAVDVGNGAGGFYPLRILSPLGADVSGSQFLSPDGNFPNHIPNPENKIAMKSISDCVLKSGADIGIIFDTDVDRAAVVSGSGVEINRNSLIALISKILLNETKDAVIVTDSVTSEGLTEFIEKEGGVHHRFKRGYKNVIDEATRLCETGKNAVLAIETSGHAAFKENYFLDDGAYLVTRILIEMAKMKLSTGKKLDVLDLIKDLKMPKEEREIRLTFKTENWKDYGARAVSSLEHFSEKSLDLIKPSFEGVRARVKSGEGIFTVRLSVHDPIMVINIDSDKVGGCKIIAKILYAFFSSFSGIDSSPLKNIE